MGVGGVWGLGESGGWGRVGGGEAGSQNMFFYQPTFIALELKVSKSTKYFIVWKSKGLYKSKLLPLYGALLPNIKYFVPKIAIQFSNTLLVVEQNSYTTKIVNAYIVYDLDNWTKIPLRNSRLKSCLFYATATVKIAIKKSWCIAVME